jgi:hypothetical protein
MSLLRRRPAWVLLALTAALCACGGKASSRMTLTTPGAHTGDPSAGVALTTPTPTPSATATPKPKTKGPPVTSDERRVIKGWSDQLRAGHVNAASRYFTIPSLVSTDAGGASRLRSRADVKAFNATLPCGAMLIRTRRSVHSFVIGTFKLTDRPGGTCGTGTGALAEVAFLIRHHRINQWVRLADPTPTPSATPNPATDSATGIS